MGLFSKKKKNELVLLFGIGSSSVGGALFYTQESGVPKIIYTVREPIIIEGEVNVDHFLPLTLEALKVVVNKISVKGLGAPDRIVCVLSSPWYASQTRLIKLTNDKPTAFTSKLADELIQKEVKIFEDEYLKNFSNGDKDLQIIELKNLKTTLNGYATTNPLGQKAREIEMSVFISIAETYVLEKIKESISLHFRNSNIKFASFIMTSFTVVRDMFVNQENFLLVNISGEVTDISMIKKDVLLESISFPMGRNFMVRNLVKELDCTLDEAKTFLSLYKDGHMAKGTAKKVEPAIIKVKGEWLKSFQEFLSNLTNDISIPSTIFITVDKDLAEFFTEIIKTEQFNQYLLTESKFRVIFLGSQELHGIALFEENTSHDPFLTIESIYINRFLR